MRQRNKITSISYRLARCNGLQLQKLCSRGTMWRLAWLCSSLSSVFAQRWTRFCYWHRFCISPDCIIMFFCWFHSLHNVLSLLVAFATTRTSYPTAAANLIDLYIVIIRIPWNVVCFCHAFGMLCLVMAVVQPKIASPIEQKRTALAELCNNLWKVFNLQNIQQKKHQWQFSELKAIAKVCMIAFVELSARVRWEKKHIAFIYGAVRTFAHRSKSINE